MSAVPADSLPDQADVLIIGAGVIGLSVAYALRQAGRDVLVLDQGRAGGGASHGNCGTLTPSHALPLAQPGMVVKALRWMLKRDAPFYVQPRVDPALWTWLFRFAGRCNDTAMRDVGRYKAAFLKASRTRLADWIAAEQWECEFAARGQIAVYKDPATFAAQEALRPLLSEIGIDMLPKSGAEVLRMSPGLKADIHAGHFYPGDAEFRPDRYVAALLAGVRKHGVTVTEHCAVSGFVEQAGQVQGVTAGGKTIKAREVVLASGVLSPKLGNTLGIRLPIQPGKGYSITFEKPSQPPALPLVLKERAICVTPWGSAYRLGSTMEFSGLSERLNPLRIAAIKRGAAEYLLEPYGPSEVEQWYGFRPMTFDDLPIIGPAPRHRGLWIASGHGMLGMSMSAATAEQLAAMIQERATPFDPKPMLPARFG
ncbi:amino acid dehydrogenase [Ahniella affigens]|uniref:Amino acid dehydrogenase n=1 Tax=Ahniella affigens TaxID=2021234 RepID=A0A2P1PQH0_9GAMM|nr:FAD-dependent oxidoreductase [Ahniella affigens]AVP97084.1 amino acid dehydrogenase [Ahniella affigens]